MSIFQYLNQIKDGEIVLPAIQRDFVWKEEKIEKLFDSIMRGYPVGIILLWETYENISYRKFENNHRPGNAYTFEDNKGQKRLKVVLDGQQRLQALYIGIYGQHNGRYLYLDILSGGEHEDYQEERYSFWFANDEEVQTYNMKEKQSATNRELTGSGEDDQEPAYYLRVSDIFPMSAIDKERLKQDISKALSLKVEEQMRVGINLAQLDTKLTTDETVLKFSIIDENESLRSPNRKSESDVLEIFVRINRQGTPLTRSDLIFSMLKLNWKKSAEALPEFVDRINSGNSFNFNVDFIIRCLFAVSDLGTKFDVDLLRKKSHMDTVKKSFEPCCSSIESLVGILQNSCWLSSSRVIKGDYNTLVPFVYYLFIQPKHRLLDAQVDDFRKSLFLFAFTGSFGRYADSRIGRFIKLEIKPLTPSSPFPLNRTVAWVAYWDKVSSFDEWVIQRNSLLALHIVQQLGGHAPHHRLDAPEMDHIFPRSVLREKGFDEALVNHYANFWILSRGKNANKSNKHPAQYFKDVSDLELRRALINRDLLDYRSYKRFINTRGERILEKVKEKTGFNDQDFEFLKEETE